MATVYLDRDYKITLTLTQDGDPPVQDVITKAVLWVPGSAFADGNPRIFDTTPEITLTDNATKVAVDLAQTTIKKGAHYCYLTIYDAANTNGIPWDTLIIRVSNWPATV